MSDVGKMTRAPKISFKTEFTRYPSALLVKRSILSKIDSDVFTL